MGGYRMSEKQFTTKNIICSNYCVFDNNDKAYGNDELVILLNEQQEQLDLYKEAILTMLGLLAEKGIILSGVKDE